MDPSVHAALAEAKNALTFARAQMRELAGMMAATESAHASGSGAQSLAQAASQPSAVQGLDDALCKLHELEETLAANATPSASPSGAQPPVPAASQPPAVQGLGELVCSIGELSFTSPRGKMEVLVHASGIQLKAKAFTLSIAAEALLRCIELDLGNRNGLTCLLQLEPSRVTSEGQVPKGGTEYCAFTRKPTDPDLRAKLSEVGVGPVWLTSTPFKADTGKPFVPAYVKAAEVQIVPLETHLLVLGKPTLCIAYDHADISMPDAVNGRKTFDMGLAFSQPDGSGKGSCELSMVPTQAHAALFDFIRRCKRLAGKRKAPAAPSAGGADTEGKEAGGEEEEQGEEGGEEEGDDEDGDESEEEGDEDFKPGDDSEPEEEYDSDGGEPMPEDDGAMSEDGADESDSESSGGKDGDRDGQSDQDGDDSGPQEPEPAAKAMRTS